MVILTRCSITNVDEFQVGNFICRRNLSVVKAVQVFLLLGGLCAGTVLSPAEPFGLGRRVANTTLRMPGALPTFGFTTTNAFEGLTFNFPVATDST